MMDANCGSNSFWDPAVGKCSKCSGDVCLARSPDLPESCICYCVNEFPGGTYTYQQKATCGFKSDNLFTNPPWTTIGTPPNEYKTATVVLAIFLGAAVIVIAVLCYKLWRQRRGNQASSDIEEGEGGGHRSEKDPLMKSEPQQATPSTQTPKNKDGGGHRSEKDPLMKSEPPQATPSTQTPKNKDGGGHRSEKDPLMKSEPQQATPSTQTPKNTETAVEPEPRRTNGAPPSSEFNSLNPRHKEQPGLPDSEQGGEETGRKEEYRPHGQEEVPVHHGQEEGPNDPSAATHPTDHRILKGQDASTSTPD